MTFKNKSVSLDNGRGYIEKDWGVKFPKAHIWVQCNRFKKSSSSLSIAIAKLRVAEVLVLGFVAVLDTNDKRYVFSRYHLSGLKVNASSSELSLCFTSLQYTLTIHANIGAPIALKSPGEAGIMTEIQESVSTSVSLKLSERKGKTVLTDTGFNAGLEVVGEW